MIITLDWLSVTVRAPKDKDIFPVELMQTVVDVMYLGDYLRRSVYVGSAKYYSSITRIDDISFKMCKQVEGASHKQGVMIEFTSNGLSKYQAYLSSIGVSLVEVFRNLRSMTVAGFVVNFPRLDIAMDDICKDGECPLLRIERIYKAWAEHLFCSRARPIDRSEALDFKSENDDLFKSGKVCDKKKKGMIGRTVYFGSRKSAVSVRFYDKKIEQLQKGREVSEDIKHWVRCEYEFHKERACSIVAMLIDNQWKDFVADFARCVLGHLRFIKLDDSNRSRCSTCSWWVKFLDNICHADKFVIPPKRPTQADRTIAWLRHSVFPTVYAYIVTLGTEEFMNEVYEEGKKKLGFKQMQFMSDYVDSNRDVDDMTSLLYNIIFWCSLTCRPLPDVLQDMDKDYKSLAICKKYRSQLNGDTAELVKMAIKAVE